MSNSSEKDIYFYTGPELPPSEMLIVFLEHTANPKTNKVSFILRGSNTFDANAYVQAMRVALSRLRKKYSAQGRKLKYFKMLLTSLSPTESGDIQIILEKAISSTKKLEAFFEKNIDAITKVETDE